MTNDNRGTGAERGSVLISPQDLCDINGAVFQRCRAMMVMASAPASRRLLSSNVQSMADPARRQRSGEPHRAAARRSPCAGWRSQNRAGSASSNPQIRSVFLRRYGSYGPVDRANAASSELFSVDFAEEMEPLLM